MSCITKPLTKPSPLANSCPLSLPSIFTATSSSRCPYLSIQSKPFKLNLACSYSSSSLPTFFSHRKRTQFPTLVSVVGAQQEEDETTVLDQQEVGEGEEGFDWGNQEGDGSGTEASDWEVESGGEGAIDAVVDAGEETVGEDGFAVDGDFPEPPEEAKIFVGNLPYNVESEGLAHLFEPAGTVEIAEVIYNRQTQQSRGFGFVTMSTVEEAEKAVEMFHSYDLDGRLLTVNKAAPRGTQPERPPRVFDPSYRLYVGNLPWDVDSARLEQLFSEHGKVVSARVVYDQETGRSRGFGFVTMSTEAELNDAIANLDGESVDGRPIRVNVAEERPRRSI